MTNPNTTATRPLVEVKNLKKYFTVKEDVLTKLELKAVDDVSFAINPGETLGLVGESGCGDNDIMMIVQ